MNSAGGLRFANPPYEYYDGLTPPPLSYPS